MKKNGMMTISRDMMLKVLKSAARIPIRQLYFAESRPAAPKDSLRITTVRVQRFIMPLTKTKRIRYAEKGVVKEEVFQPGDVLWIKPYSWTTEMWDTDHTMLSVVFYERMIRVLFIHHDGSSRPPSGPDIFFHTEAPLTTCGNHLLQAINQSSSGTSAAARYAFSALLGTVCECLERNQEVIDGKETFTWDCIQDCLENHAFTDVDRNYIAKALRLHPAHVSRLVKKYAGCCFSEYLTKMRMERAVALLEDNTLSVDEIAGLCGYNYTSYFIKVFRSYFVDSPACYREKRKKNWK